MEAKCQIKDFVDKGVNIQKPPRKVVEVDVQVEEEEVVNSTIVNLNLNENLSNIRKILEQKSSVNINSTLSFAKYKTSKEGNTFSKVSGEDEGHKTLIEIIQMINDNESSYKLHLRKSSTLDWKYLNKKRQLEFGRVIVQGEIKEADKQAYEMKDCKLTLMNESNNYKFESKEEWMKESKSFFSADMNAQYYAKLGISTEIKRKEKSSSETNISYHCTKYERASLEFGKFLKPRIEFIDAVKDALNSKDVKKFKIILEEFGQFISTEVILGGKAYIEGSKVSKELSKLSSSEVSANLSTGPAVAKAGLASKSSNGSSDYTQHDCLKLIGGKVPDITKFDEDSWYKSLSDYRNWDCIEFRNPVSIFKFLMKTELQKDIISLVGKKIIYSKVESIDYLLESRGKPKIVELVDIPSNVLKIINNKDADCNFFATVIDTKDEKNDFFHCQILYSSDEQPSLIIHCIQNEFKKRECKLKIRWMVIGYRTDLDFALTDFDVQLNIERFDFDTSKGANMSNRELLKFKPSPKKFSFFGIPALNNLDNEFVVIGHHFYKTKNNGIGLYVFAYDLKNNHYVNLPKFTFYTLVISNYHNSSAYGLSSFECNNTDLPKYFSLYSKEEKNCGPIFLKQKQHEIKAKQVLDKMCNQDSCICKNEPFKKANDDLEYYFFNPENF
ncbi:4575_t:CDS:2 [Funneliformis geosporum]|uniref:10536_t:CDS:1 n=1 Tax=Funneliformis geosporum TaxID=1117311 RepID=A0A9W4X2E2_9GLOM|nr:10536_t:CDS:2 [Funneliformis geosporum]CAI2181563.1 4575_t:CDS:2 [Funneliformis geosporum]